MVWYVRVNYCPSLGNLNLMFPVTCAVVIRLVLLGNVSRGKGERGEGGGWEWGKGLGEEQESSRE